jgi:DNA (cytosine-5)-methyltransferase 1
MKVLNLYASIGGNRKLWANCEVTAVEIDENIAKIYQDFFPNDKIVVGDAHKYLEQNFEQFDFIWSSPPCPTHSRVRKATRHQNKPIFPDMKLYEEIIFLMHYYDGKWCVENVNSYYEPLIQPQIIDRHFFWANFTIDKIKHNYGSHDTNIEEMQKHKGFDLTKYSNIDKRKILRNCVLPEVGLNIFECSKRRNLF